MTPPVFACAAERLAAAVVGDTLVLDGPEGRHAAVVRRLTPGEELDLVDGRGTRVRGSVAIVAGERLQVAVLARTQRPRPDPAVVVVQALAKGDRGEAAVEMLTEVGVDRIVPWAASRSVARWEGDRGERSLRRWRSVAAEAAKQARRDWWPEVDPPASTATVAALLGTAQGVVLHEAADRAFPDVIGNLDARGDVVVVVGPEGGVTAQELTAFLGAGAVATRLGPEVLRTSTAGVAAVAALSVVLGRWGGPVR